MATSLVSALSSMAAAIPGIGKQRFANVMANNDDMVNLSSGQMIIFIIVFALSVWLLMFLGGWVFNTSIPRFIPAVRKITTLEFFGLYIVCHILFT